MKSVNQFRIFVKNLKDRIACIFLACHVLISISILQEYGLFIINGTKEFGNVFYTFINHAVLIPNLLHFDMEIHVFEVTWVREFKMVTQHLYNQTCTILYCISLAQVINFQCHSTFIKNRTTLKPTCKILETIVCICIVHIINHCVIYYHVWLHCFFLSAVLFIQSHQHELQWLWALIRKISLIENYAYFWS